MYNCLFLVVVFSSVLQCVYGAKPVLLIVSKSRAKLVHRPEYPDDKFDPALVNKGVRNFRKAKPADAWNPQTGMELRFPPNSVPKSKKE